MSKNNEIKIIITGDTDNAAQKIQSFGSSFKKVFSKIEGQIDNATRNLGVFGAAITALSSGMVLKRLLSLKDFMPIDDALLMMQANLKMTGKDLDGFKNKLVAMAGTAGEDMAALFSISAKLSKIYQPEDILKIMEASAMASDAMEQDLSLVAERVVQIMRIYKKTPDEAKAIAESITAAEVPLESLDILIQRGILKGGMGDYKDMLAFIGGLEKSGRGSARVLMSYQGALSALFEKGNKLKAIGIDVLKIDPQTGQKVKKDAIEILQELNQVIQEVGKTMGEDEIKQRFDNTFGEGTGEGIFFLITQLDNLKKAKDNQSNAAVIAADKAAKADEKWSEQLEKIKAHLDSIKTDLSFIYDLAKKPIKFLAESPGITKAAGYGAIGLSALLLGGLAYGKGKQFLKGLGGTAAGIAQGKAVEAATGVTPVFVTNWPAGGGVISGGVTDVLLGKKMPAAVLSRMGGILRLGAAIAGAKVALAGAAGYAIGTGINKFAGYLAGVNKPSDKWYEGGIGGYLGEKLYDLLHPEEAKLLNKNTINMNIRIDEKNRIYTETDNMDTDINLDRGLLN